MNKNPINLPASLHQRLKNAAEKAGKQFQEYLYYYSFERFLFRLASSHYKDDFLLKGGLMFSGWGIPLRRPTRDIDMQGIKPMTVADLVAMIKEICLQEVEPDGMRYDPDSVKGEQIIETSTYPGIRIHLIGYLGESQAHLQLDISFANVITPRIIEFNYPTLLGMQSFRQRGYTIETAMAEKIQAIVSLGRINDRMRDFFDLWLLVQSKDLKQEPLVNAITATFINRQTALPDTLPIGLADEFAQSREEDWRIFLKRAGIDNEGIPPFSIVIGILRESLWPVIQSAKGKV